MTNDLQKVLDSGRVTPYIGQVNKPMLTAEKVRAALIAGDGSPSKAAAILGVSRQTVHTWMKEKGIRVERRVVHEAA